MCIPIWDIIVIYLMHHVCVREHVGIMCAYGGHKTMFWKLIPSSLVCEAGAPGVFGIALHTPCYQSTSLWLTLLSPRPPSLRTLGLHMCSNKFAFLYGLQIRNSGDQVGVAGVFLWPSI